MYNEISHQYDIIKKYGELQSQKHNFLVSLHIAFETKHKFFLVFDLMKGGDLVTMLGKKKSFSESVTKFYIACIILGLGHLHKNDYHHNYKHLTMSHI